MGEITNTYKIWVKNLVGKMLRELGADGRIIL
jgi:hypothetical protein